MIDNADALLEDPALVERLFDAIDGNAEWSVLAASRFSGVNNLAEAVSSVLRRCRLVPLRPFWSPGMIRACLVGPLEPGEADRLMPSEKELGLLVDLLQLSMGNPFDIALIAGHLWDACEVGEMLPACCTRPSRPSKTGHAEAFSRASRSAGVGSTFARTSKWR